MLAMITRYVKVAKCGSKLTAEAFDGGAVSTVDWLTPIVEDLTVPESFIALYQYDRPR